MYKGIYGITLSCCLAMLAGNAMADEANNTPNDEFSYVASSREARFRDINQGYAALPEDGEVIEQNQEPLALSKQDKGNKDSFDDDLIDGLMEHVPYSRQLKSTWKFIDGETDVYYEGLRFNRHKKGLTYTMNDLPLIGDMEGGEVKATVGQESELQFETDNVPYMGRFDGLKFRTSVGSEDSKISIRYKIDLP